MNITASIMTPRKVAIQTLSKARGRADTCPLDPSLISKWCADLGFPPHLREFDEGQMAQLNAVNMHYAQGGNRKQLLKKMENTKWYTLQS